MSEAPIVYGKVEKRRGAKTPQWCVVTCPYCRELHIHNLTEGVRLSHCDDPRRRKVYDIRLEVRR